MKEHEKVSSFQGTLFDLFPHLSLVTMTQWTHLFPYRTEKLSTVVAKVAERQE